MVVVSISFVRDVRSVKRTSSLTYLPSFILSLMIRITVLVTLFSLETYTSTCLNSLNFLLENCNGNKESQDYINISLISYKLFGSNETRLLEYSYLLE